MPRPSEYELERQANIERNQQLLKSLGIFNAEVAPSRKAKTVAATENKKTVKKRRRASDVVAHPPPRRKSARLAATASAPQIRDNMSSDPIDLFSASRSSESPVRARPAIKLRRLSSIPAPIMEEAGEDEHILNDTHPDSPPTRDKKGALRFKEEPYFMPNMTPEEMIRAGSFGGTAFQEHNSTILHRILPSTDFLEFPESWYSGLAISKYLTSPIYRPEMNKYGVKSGQTLSEWEDAGWIREQDPRGWFQWYCRYYLGRRSPDDGRQIRRWLGVCGPAGRFKKALVRKIVEQGGRWDDESISPVLRQTLQHWGYKLNESDYRAYL